MEWDTERLRGLFEPECFFPGEKMSAHTSFKIGGPADCYALVKTPGQLAEAIRFCAGEGVPYFVMGNGTNLLVRDGGFRGAVLCLKQMNDVEWSEERREVTAGAGALLSKIANFALDRDLAGFEFASGIPGTLGGAVYMNAGAYGGEMKDVFVTAEVLFPDGSVRTLGREEMGFGYRASRLQNEEAYVLSVALAFSPGNYVAIKDKMLELNKLRAEKQPLELPSAGSAFKRPQGGYASLMIQDCGLKGLTIGGARVSEKHAGFIVNAGEAAARDVLELTELIREKVFARFGVWLEPEYKTIGED